MWRGAEIYIEPERRLIPSNRHDGAVRDGKVVSGG